MVSLKRLLSDGKLTETEISQAFRVCLKRAPDPGGLATYLQRGADPGFTLGQLYEELLASPEYESLAALDLSRQRAETGGPEIVTVDISGVKISVNAREKEFGQHIAAHGSWEPTIAAIILGRLAEGNTFVDVGANIGVMSLQAARKVGPGGRVLAFEPNADNISRLISGIVANGFENVTVFPFGLSHAHDVLFLHGGSNGFLMGQAPSARRVLTVPADEFLQHEERIDLVKIDVEGHEPSVLAGMAGTLARHKPTVLCEFNPRCLRDHAGVDPSGFAAEIFRLTSRVEVVQPFDENVAVASADDLMALWHDRNRHAVEAGLLPDGMIHFDLVFRSHA